jgi:hypothetical protein
VSRGDFLLRSKFLRFHGVDPVGFARRHGIVPFTHPCQECSEPLTTSIPFAAGTLRGLIAPTCHRCGCEITPYAVVRLLKAGDLLGPG